MNTKIAFIFAMIISCLLGAAGSASAQWKDNMGGSWNNPTSASVGNIVNDSLWNRVFAKARARDKARTAAGTNTGGVKTPEVKPLVTEPQVSKRTPAQIDAAVSFRSTGTQLETQGIATELAGDDADLKKDLITIITTLVNEYEKAAKAQGKPNDLALATTAALVYNSSIYNGTAEPDDARIMEIRDAMAELMVEDGTLAAMTDRQKQVLYEKLVISTMLAKAGYEEAKEKGDKETMAWYREAAGQTLRMVSGMEPEKIDFSNEAARRMAQLLLDSNAALPSAVPQNVPPAPLSSGDFIDFDPFPDKQGVTPQKPLTGRIRKNISAADLAGTWEIGGSSVMEYVTSSTQSTTAVSFFGKKYFIRADGSYESKFYGRTSNTNIHESDSGSIILSSASITLSGTIILKSKKEPAMRYQFVAYMTQPNGAAVLSLIYIGDNPPLDGNALWANCSHPNGYVSCLNGEEWVRIP